MKKRGIVSGLAVITAALVLGGCGGAGSSEGSTSKTDNMIQVEENSDEGTITYLDGNGKLNVFNKEKDGFEVSSNFVNNSATARSDSEDGLINCNGKVIVEYGEYYDIYNLDDSGYYRAEKESKKGVMNSKGELIVPCAYAEVDILHFNDEYSGVDVYFFGCENDDESSDIYNEEGKKLLTGIDSMNTGMFSGMTMYGIKDKTIMTYQGNDENDNRINIYFNGATGEEIARDAEDLSIDIRQNCVVIYNETTDSCRIKTFDADMNPKADFELSGRYLLSDAQGEYFSLNNPVDGSYVVYDFDGNTVYTASGRIKIAYDSDKNVHFIENKSKQHILMNSKFEEELTVDAEYDGLYVIQYSPYFFTENEDDTWNAVDYTGKTVYEGAKKPYARIDETGFYCLYLPDHTVLVYGIDKKVCDLGVQLSSFQEQLTDSLVLVQIDGKTTIYDIDHNKEVYQFESGSPELIRSINALKYNGSYYDFSGKVVYEKKD